MKAPFNIAILDPDEYIQRKSILPVSTHAMYEIATGRFHPDGLFSEAIFGQIGTTDRLVRRGYMDLHTKVITPFLFKQLITLKGYYQEIMAGKTYAYLDPETHDLIRTTADDLNGNTGYSFFISCLPKLVFPETDSSKRHDKIMLLEKYKDRILMDKLILLPAGLRDVREEGGRKKSEEVNKLYHGLLSLTQAMPEDGTEDPLYDGIRYQIQMKVQQIYLYIINLLDGKGGFGQSKYASRSVFYSNRNVITAIPISRVTSPTAPDAYEINEVMVPLYQAAKGAQPLICYHLKSMFIDQIFDAQNATVPLIDPKTLRLGYDDIEQSELKHWTTADGLVEFINDFRNPEDQFKPVTVQVKDAQSPTSYLYLVYDTGDSVHYFRNIDDFLLAYQRTSSYSTRGVLNFELLADLDPNRYIVLGSTALRAYGMPHFNEDIDIVVDEQMFERIKTSGQYHRKPNGCYSRQDGKVDVYNDIVLKDTSFKTYQQQHAIQVDRYWLTKPASLLAVYQASNRPKDREKIEFLNTIVPDTSKIRPLTRAEMLYIATYSALLKRYATVTRQPILNLEGIVPFKIHVQTTQPARVVTVRLTSDLPGAPDRVLPEYPILDGSVGMKTSMSVHPATLPKYDGVYLQVAVVKSRNEAGSPTR